MTTTLEKAVLAAQALSENDQDWMGQLILETIRDEQQWDRQFSESQDMLIHMADKALAEYQAGQTRTLSD